MRKLMTCTVLLVASISACTTSPAGHRLSIVPPIQITEAERFRDGGSLRLNFVDNNNKPILVHMDYRYGGPRAGEVLWVPRGTNSAHKLVPGGDQEADLIAVLRIWLDEHVPVVDRARLTQLDRPPLDPAKDYVAWMVLRMTRTLEGRANK